MKVADHLASDATYNKNLPEAARSLSIENKGATRSPATMLDAVSAYDDAKNTDQKEAAKKVVERLSKMSNRKLKFEYREEADVYQITVVDEEDEVIRKIPADGVLRIIENLERLRGLSFDAKA